LFWSCYRILNKKAVTVEIAIARKIIAFAINMVVNVQKYADAKIAITLNKSKEIKVGQTKMESTLFLRQEKR